METEALYKMAAAAAKGAELPLLPTNNSDSQIFYQRYGGYLMWGTEYNRLLPFVHQSFGAEAQALFSPLTLPSPNDTAGMFWRTYSDLAFGRLSALAAYLHSKLGADSKETEFIRDLIQANLRASIYTDPKKEKEIQDVLDIIFRSRGLNYIREKTQIIYSSKTYIPDFTFTQLDLLVEAKLCAKSGKEKILIDEINADITAYKTKFRNIIFVIYDLGFIRDVTLFSKDIETSSDVSVLIVKK